MGLFDRFKKKKKLISDNELENIPTNETGYLCEAEKLAYIVDTSLEKEDFTAMNLRLSKLVPIQHEKIEYVFNNSGVFGSIIALVLTVVNTLLFLYFLFIGTATIVLSKDFFSIGMVVAIVSIVFLALNIALIIRLTGHIKYKIRYNAYKEIIGFKNMNFVEDIALCSKQNKTIVIKDLSKAIKQKLIPQGHFTNNNLVFMVSDKVYDKYIEKSAVYDRYFQEQLENRQRTQARTKRTNQIMETGEQYIKKLNHFKVMVKDKTVSKKIEHIENIAGMIFHEIDVNSSTVNSLGVFLNYYLPTTEKLLDTYISITEKKIDVPNLTKAKKEIENSFSIIIHTYESILEKIYEENEMNIKSEIEAKEIVMQKESFVAE